MCIRDSNDPDDWLVIFVWTASKAKMCTGLHSFLVHFLASNRSDIAPFRRLTAAIIQNSGPGFIRVSMESLLSYKTGTDVRGKPVEYFTRNSIESPWKFHVCLFPHGNSTGYETRNTILQDRTRSFVRSLRAGVQPTLDPSAETI